MLFRSAPARPFAATADSSARSRRDKPSPATSTAAGGERQLDGAQRFLLDAVNAQMQRLLRENNEELYERIERLENRERHEEERRGGKWESRDG